MKFEFFEYRKEKIPRYLGELEISLLGLNNFQDAPIDIYKNNLIVGQMVVVNILKETQANFISYLYKGYKIKTIMALDFSNDEDNH